jgi:hypothetical protein
MRVFQAESEANSVLLPRVVDENNQLIVRESAHLPQEEMKRFSGLRILRIAVGQVTGIFHEVRDIDSEHFGESSNPLWLRNGSCSFPFGDGLLLHSEFPGEIGLFEVEFLAAELQKIAEHRHRQTRYSVGSAVDRSHLDQ